MNAAASVPTTARHWALGIPLGWVPPSPAQSNLVGHVLYQDRIIALDKVAYEIWNDALIGRVDFSRCGDGDYLPPSFDSKKDPSGTTASPDEITVVAHHLRDIGLLWYFDPYASRSYREAEGFELVVQGIPFGNVGRVDRYRILHTDGSAALDLDRVPYAIWLQWWREPRLVRAAHAVADTLGLCRTEVVAQAVAMAVAGMHVGLIGIAKVHKR